MNPLCIYHANCADGFGAAWVFKTQAKEAFDFHPGVYSEDPPNVTGRDVYLVDFSYKRAVVEQMLEMAKSVTLIDHHKSALEDLAPLYNRQLWVHREAGAPMGSLCDLERSGAMLAWSFFRGSDEPPQLLNHIEDRDLWRFLLPDTKEIMANVFSFPYEFEVWDALMRQPLSELLSDGAAIDRKRIKDIAELLEAGTHWLTIAGHHVPAINLPYVMASDAGHALSEGRPFAACYWRQDKWWSFSLRSRQEGVDVAEVAKIYGGGGHQHAAGFRVACDDFDIFMATAKVSP